MTQSNIIGLAIIIAFVIFITTKGELPIYLSYLGIGGSSGATQSPSALGQSILRTQAPILAGSPSVQGSGIFSGAGGATSTSAPSSPLSNFGVTDVTAGTALDTSLGF